MWSKYHIYGESSHIVMKYWAFLFLLFLTACNPFFFLPNFHEGHHRLQPTTLADIQRGQVVAACLQQWAQANGYPTADYSDVNFTDLVIIRVGGDGVIGVQTNAHGDTISTWQTDARESGDTIFINEGVSNSEFVGLSRHEDVHITQQKHRELIGTDGNIHWSPPWNYCGVPLAVFHS